MELFKEDESISDDAFKSLNKFKQQLDNVEIRKLLDDEADIRGAILAIHPGAGGTESQDWVSMLYRMYLRWCEKNNYKI